MKTRRDVQEHFYNRKIRLKGNPRLDAEMQIALKNHFTKNQDYVAQGDSALTSLELIEIRSFMLSYDHNDGTSSLALWTSFIIGCTGFLRAPS